MTNTPTRNPYIGQVVSGGLQSKLNIRLNIPTMEVQEGGFVVIEQGDWRFYALIVDLLLGTSDPRFADPSITRGLPSGLAHRLHGRTLFTDVVALPALMQEVGPEPGSPRYPAFLERLERGEVQGHPIPVKTIPSHHARVRQATAGDIAEIFGKPEDAHRFVIGYTREQGHPVCIDLEKFVQRSSGVFGATGTGKSFLTRMVLAGLINYNNASLLVLDMHNEYGYDDVASDTKERVIGLKTKFPARVRVVGLGGGTMIRDQTPDFNLEIKMSDITPGDILMLSGELNLRDTSATTLDALTHSLGKDWLAKFLQMNTQWVEDGETGKKVPHPDSVVAWARSAGVNEMAAEALHSKLSRLGNRPYIREKPASDGIWEIIKLLEAGQHVVLSFGRFESDLDYLLVCNVLTRRIREVWEKKTNEFRTHHKAEPRPLVLVLEEAHKLLSRELAGQSAFGTIAREMRKYYVTLLVIDQRPSQIHDEVMSQLGSRISGRLGDDDDISAVLAGLAGKDALRGMLSRLQPKEEIMMMGWFVPMPLLVRSRRYDEKFWKELLGDKGNGKKSESQLLAEMGY